MAHFSDSANGKIKAEAKHLTRVASLVLSDYPGGTHIHLMADADHRDGFTLAAAAINGELADELRALRDALANPPAFREEADFTAWLDELIAGVDDTLRGSGIEAPKPAKVTA